MRKSLICCRKDQKRCLKPYLPYALRLLWLSVVLLGAIGSGGAGAVAPPKQVSSAFEPRALERLQQMVQAYTRLPALQQRTRYVSRISPLIAPPGTDPAEIAAREEAALAGSEQERAEAASNRVADPVADRTTSAASDVSIYDPVRLPREMRLLYARPNFLRMELLQTQGTEARPALHQWVSDGKTFWTYLPEKHWYTRTRAPKRFPEFARLDTLNSGCLELLMLMGVNPFAEVDKAADRVQLTGVATVRGVECDVVTLEMTDPYEQTESQFYIGRTDHLLRRIVVETRPVGQQAASENFNDPLERLGSTATGSTLSALPPMRRRLICDNIVSPPQFEPSTFLFEVPFGALLYGSTDAPLPTQPGLPGRKRTRSNLAEVIRNLRR